MRLLSCLQSIAAGSAALLTVGCAVVERAGIAVLYEKSALPGNRPGTIFPMATRPGSGLIFFSPPESPAGRWPFLSTGGVGPAATGVSGWAEPMCRNIGRYLAGQGVGVAVINYRLQPQVGWREQVADVARATRWVHQHIASRGGRADQLFLSVTWPALNSPPTPG